MDANRAQEILEQSTMCNVTCDGELVYIEHVDRDKGLATVHPLNNPTKKISVNVKQLHE